MAAEVMSSSDGVATHQRQDYLNWTSAQVLHPSHHPLLIPPCVACARPTLEFCRGPARRSTLTLQCQVQQWLVLLNLPQLVAPFDSGEIDGRCLLRCAAHSKHSPPQKLSTSVIVLSSPSSAEYRFLTLRTLASTDMMPPSPCWPSRHCGRRS